MDNDEELTIEDIVNLKSSCSKKVFDNFIEQKFKDQVKCNTSSSQKEVKKSKKQEKEDLEFKKVFGCERNRDARKPTIDKRAFMVDQQPDEIVDDEDKPEQMSTKFRPPKLREVFKINDQEKELRDPRFDKSSGYFNPTRFEKSYNFVKEARDNDKKLLQKSLKKTRDEERKKEISKVIQRISNQEHSEKKQLEKQKLRNQLIEEKKQQFKGKMKDVDQKQIFVNKGDLKKKELIETFKNLKKSQKLTKYLERKRKKNTSREKKSFLSASSRND